MGSVVPRCGDVCEFSQGGSDHDHGRHCASQSNSGPSHWSGGFEFGLGGVNAGRVEGGIVPKEGDMEDPNAIEIDEEVSCRSLLIVGLEEHFVPVDLSELHIPLRGRKVNESFLWGGEIRAIKEKTDVEPTPLPITIRAIPSGYQKSWLISSYPIIWSWSRSLRTNFPSTTS